MVKGENKLVPVKLLEDRSGALSLLNQSRKYYGQSHEPQFHQKGTQNSLLRKDLIFWILSLEELPHK